jgi:uncharacterized membrane protein
LSESQLQNFIKQDILPDILVYLGTYLVVASSWISHYRIILYLKRSSSSFIILNVLFLASIVFLPVPVVFFYLYRNQAEVWHVFALTQVVTSTTLLLMWVVARADHLLDPEIPPEYLRYTTARLLIIPLGTLLSIGISFYNVWVAEGIFLIFYLLGWVLRGRYYRHHPGGRYLEGTVRMCSITDNMTAVAITFLIASITGPLFSNAQQSFSTALHAVLAALPVYGLTFLVATGLMLLVIWWYAAYGHRLIDGTMDRFTIMTFALRALLIPIIFLLSMAIILFRKDLAFSFWLPVIVLEVADLVYRRIRRRSHEEDRLPAEAEK